MRGHHTNSDSANLFHFIERRTQENEEHTKEESRTLCSDIVVMVFLYDDRVHSTFHSLKVFLSLIINERKYDRQKEIESKELNRRDLSIASTSR